MERLQPQYTGRGYFAIGIERHKTPVNLGTLWRTAQVYGAAFVFTVGKRYDRRRDAGVADVNQAYRTMPVMHFPDAPALLESLPLDCPLIGIELDDRAHCISEHVHLARSCYVLGAEDHGLTLDMRKRCHALVQLPGRFSQNVAVAGAIVMHDRWDKAQRNHEQGTRRRNPAREQAVDVVPGGL
jgi:tRNA G18 (ribose-2'-O)-methylase SpoU